MRFGQLLITDAFYKDKPDILDWVKMGVLGVEMEAYAIYLNAARAGKKLSPFVTFQTMLLLIKNCRVKKEAKM